MRSKNWGREVQFPTLGENNPVNTDFVSFPSLYNAVSNKIDSTQISRELLFLTRELLSLSREFLLQGEYTMNEINFRCQYCGAYGLVVKRI